MRVLIVDDERPARNRLSRLLSAQDGVEIVGEAETGLAGLEMIDQHKPDVVLLDVQMPELTGIEVAQELHGPDIPLIIFVTAYDRYALQAFEVSAVDYLLKPVATDRLAKALAKASRMIDARAGVTGTLDQLRRLTEALAQSPRTRLQRIVGRRGQRMYLLPLENVQAFVAEDELVFALTAEGRHLVNHTLKDLETKLDRERFVRVHKQTIVNLARLAGGTTVDISRRYAVALREKLGW